MSTLTNKTPFWNRANLKILAVISMTVDHFGAVVISTIMALHPEISYLPLLYRFMRGFGRIAFPLYGYMLAEGFELTHNRSKYFKRIGLFALISEIPFDIALNLTMKQLSRGQILHWSYQNVFFTLFLAFGAIWITAKLRESFGDTLSTYLAGLLFALAIGALAEFIRCDYGSGGVLGIYFCYLARELVVGHIQTPERASAALASRPALPIVTMVVVLVLCDFIVDHRAIMTNSEWYAMIAALLIMNYHGEKGRKQGKYFFYIVYPLQFLIFGIIRIHLLR